eukprot:5123467-Lingulodinium_polyedra.AAC.1
MCLHSALDHTTGGCHAAFHPLRGTPVQVCDTPHMQPALGALQLFHCVVHVKLGCFKFSRGLE